MKRLQTFLLAAGLLCGAAPLGAQFAPPESSKAQFTLQKMFVQNGSFGFVPYGAAPYTCTAAVERATYYDTATHLPMVCDGTSWTAMGGGGANVVGTTSACAVGVLGTANSVCLSANTITGEGATADGFETLFSFSDPAADGAFVFSAAAAGVGIAGTPGTVAGTAGATLTVSAGPPLAASATAASAGGPAVLRGSNATADTDLITGVANGGAVSVQGGMGVGTTGVGGAVNIQGGIGGRSFKIVDQSLIDLSTDTITITVNGGTPCVGTFTAAASTTGCPAFGIQCITSSAACATATAAAITANTANFTVTGLTAVAGGATGTDVILAKPEDSTINTLAISTACAAGECTATSGTNGAIVASTATQASFPNGTAAAPGIAVTGTGNSIAGLYYNTDHAGLGLASAGLAASLSISGMFLVPVAARIGWSSTAAITTNPDTGLSRVAAGVVRADNGTTGLGAFMAGVSVETVAATKAPTVIESGELYTNGSDTDGQAITLPDNPTVGACYAFALTATNASGVFNVAPNTGETLSDAGTSCAAAFSATAVGATARICAVSGGAGGQWFVMSKLGTWTCTP